MSEILLYQKFTDSNVVTSISLRLVARLFQAGPYTASVPKTQGKTVTFVTRPIDGRGPTSCLRLSVTSGFSVMSQ